MILYAQTGDLSYPVKMSPEKNCPLKKKLWFSEFFLNLGTKLASKLVSYTDTVSSFTSTRRSTANQIEQSIRVLISNPPYQV